MVVASGCAGLGNSATAPSASSTPSAATPHAHVCAGTIPEPGQSFPPPDSDERYALTDEVELLVDALRADHRDWVDTLWVDHEPDFQLVIRASRGFSLDELCDLVAHSPIPVLVQPPAAHTYAELERGFETLSEMWGSGDPLFAQVDVAELWVDPRTSMVVLANSKPLSDELIASLSDIAGVPVRFVLLKHGAEIRTGRPPECIGQFAHCRP